MTAPTIIIATLVFTLASIWTVSGWIGEETPSAPNPLGTEPTPAPINTNAIDVAGGVNREGSEA